MFDVSNCITDVVKALSAEWAVKAGIGDREGDYGIRIRQLENSTIHVSVTGPEGLFERRFEGNLQTPSSICGYFDRAIPRSVPRSIDVLCDYCIRALNGTVLKMEPVTLVCDGIARPGYAYKCEYHNRVWHRSMGYASAGSCPHGRRDFFRPPCRACDVTMYIEFAGSCENLRVRCPNCYRYAFAALP